MTGQERYVGPSFRSGAHAEPLPREFADAFDARRSSLGRLATRVIYFPTIGSTNDVASRMAMGDSGRDVAEGLVVLADAQTAGRGRRGRTWFSPPASGLYVSVIVDPGRARQDPDRAMALLTIAAGVALSEAIEETTGLRADIKWPNDLYVAKRKLAGILAEGVTGGSGGSGGSGTSLSAVVLGYGINVGPMSYPPELADRATSLETELGRAVDRAAICAATLVALARRYDDLIDGRFDAILDGWRARSPNCRGARVTWQSAAGTTIGGTTAGIDERGALLVQTGDRIERIVSGELLWP